MKVVILAAGRGKRMGEYTESTTKAMLPILSDDQKLKPMLQITIERFVNVGLKEFIIVVGYRKEDIINHFSDGENFGAKIQYITQKDVCAGTADAVKCVNYFFEGHQGIDHETPFFLVFGDVVPTEHDIELIFIKYIDSVRENNYKHCGVMAVRTVEDPQRYGVVEVRNDNVVRIVEKSPNPPRYLFRIDSCVATLHCKVYKHVRNTKLSERGEYELTDSIQMLINSEVDVKIQPVGGLKDIGTKQIYENESK